MLRKKLIDILIKVNFYPHLDRPKINIKKSLRARQLKLSFSPKEESMTLTVPYFMPSIFVHQFLATKQGWIEKQWKKCEDQKKHFPQHTYKEGDFFWYLGQKLTLKIIVSPRALDKRFNKRAYKVINDVVQVTVAPQLSISDQILKVKELLVSFYKQKASEVIHDRLDDLNKEGQFMYHRVTFRNQKTRWGSCSSRGNLNFNWRLVMAPIEVIDYVVFHELCHLRQMNHSKKFWNLVSQKIPDHKQHRKWLRENGARLKV